MSATPTVAGYAMEPSQLSPPAGEPGQRPRSRGLHGAVGFALVLVPALVYIGLVDPHDTGSVYPPCPFKLFTGWNCPGCGGLRMVHDLLHGDLAASFNDNAFLLVGIPLAAAWFFVRRHRKTSSFGLPATITVVVALVVWTVVRNLPGFPLVPTVLSG